MNSKKILDILNTSPLQQGILFHHLYEQDDPYVVQNEVSLEGRLDPEALKQGFARLTQKHDVLRAVVLHEKLASPKLVVRAEVEPVFDLHDLSAMDLAEAEACFADRRLQAARRGFRLDRGPLVRMALFRMGAQAWRLLVTSHHIVMDGWCNGVFFGQLIRFAREAQAGIASDVRRDASFCDYLKWLDRQDPAQAMAFWKERLAALPDQATVVPFIRHAGGAAQPQSLVEPLGAELTQSLKQLAKAWDVTLNSVLQALWAVVLGRYNDSGDVVFGTVVSGRPEHIAGVETSLGAYINTIPVRCGLEGRSFEQLARSVHEFFRESVPSQHLALLEIQKQAGAAGPLFDHLFVYQNFPFELGGSQGDFRITGFKGHESTSYPLNVVVSEAADGLQVAVKFDAARIDEAQVRRLQAHLRTAAARVAVQPYLQANQVDVLPDDERRQVLVGFNATRRPWPTDTHVLELIDGIVQVLPEHTAVVEAGRCIPYRELDRMAEAVRGALMQRGCGRGEVVGVLADNSAAMVAAMLGVMRAGAAFLPMDPKNPQARLEQVLAQARVRLLLSQPADLRFESLPALEVLPLHEAVAGPAPRQPAPAVEPGDIAYVIFTSGSTGVPKGVPVSHGALLNLCLWHEEAFGLDTTAHATKYASPGFDASVWEIFPALACGAALHVVPEALRLDIAGLHAWFEQQRITHAFLPTPVCEQFQKRDNATLKVLLTGGDTLRDTGYSRGYCLVNNYGPTENAVVSTSWEVVRGAAEVSIGRPIANTQAYVLDSRLQPCPIGVPGELCLGGAGLAAGYLHDEALTRQKFIDNPIGRGRLYRSGDLASWNADGTLRFLGRRDGQVKINGNRIECGEIEAVAVRVPGVTGCKAQAVQHGGKASLWLFYEAPADARLETELAASLQQRLPAYMVPARLMRVETLPLTTNGKIDAKQLDAMAQQSLGERPAREPVAWSGRDRVVIEGVARELGLAPEQIGPDDHFFALGGDSIRAMRLVAHIQKQLDVSLHITEVFRHPVMRELLARVHGQGEAGDLPLAKAGPSDHYPMSSEQLRLFFLSQVDRSTAYNVSNVFEMPAGLGVVELERVFRALIRRHKVLRTIHREVDGEARQSILEEVPFSVAEVEIAELTEAAVAAQVRPFDLAREIPIRVTVLRTARASYLLLDVHHLIMDMASMRMLMVDFRDLCMGRELAPLPFDYVDYCVWREQQAAQGHAEATAFWQRTMADAPRLNFPSDHPRPPVKSFRGERLQQRWSAEDRAQIQAWCQRRGLTTFTYLAGALAIALERFSGDRDVLIGTPIDLRRYGQLDKVVGMFTGTLPVRLQPDPSMPVGAYFDAVREHVIDCFRHADLPFERIVELSGQKKDANRNPLFDVMLVVRETLQVQEADGGLSLRPVPMGRTTAKFDMLVDVELCEEGIRIDAEYCTDLYRIETIASFIDTFRRVCLAAPQAERAQLGELDVLGAEQRERLLHGFNRTAKPFDRDLLVHELLSRRAAQAPQALAVIDGEARHTLQSLDIASNQLAHALRAAGVGRGDLVAVRMGRSFGMMVGVFAALKAGAAYVPLDPEYPDERTTLILRNAGAKALLVDRPLPGSVDFEGRCIDLSAERFDALPAEAPERVNDARDPVVVIHTSGSTGVPKGVVISHRMLINSLQSMENDYPVRAGDVYLFKTNVVFDVSTTELFSFVMGQGSVAVLPTGEERDPERIRRCIAQHGVTHMNFVPSMLDAFLDHPALRPADLASVKYLFVAGEKFLPTTLARIRDARMGATVVNIYGPSETFYTTQCVVDAGAVLAGQRPIPIGRPFDNLQVYLLDARLQPVPRGAIGELCVSGDGVANGYLDCSLEAGRFVDNPFVPGARMYRTGDLARLREDGQIEYLGRRDRQVKIAGRRVECSEIEGAILQHTPALQAVVKTWGASAQDLRLCAYVQLPEGADAQGLRAALADRLPAFMIPAVFVPVQEFPRTASGKIDLNRLPEPELAGVASAIVKPSTLLEARVHKLWAQALQLDPQRLGCHDDFFDLGGTSLGLIRMAALIAKNFGAEVSVEELFRHRTVAEVAALLERQRDQEPLSPLTCFNQGRPRTIFCVPGINGHALGFKDLAHALKDHALYCLEPIDIRARALVPLESMEAMCQGYLQALKQAQPAGPYRLIGHSSGGLVALRLAAMLEQQGDEVDGVVLLDSFASFEGQNLEWILERPRMASLGADYVNHIFSGFERYLGQDLGLAVPELGRMSDDERLAHVAGQLARHQITPDADPAFVRQYLEMRKRHESMVTAYYVGSERGAFRGRVSLVKAGDLFTHQDRDPREDYGWGAFLPQGVGLVTSSGNHESLITGPHAPALAAVLEGLFAQAEVEEPALEPEAAQAGIGRRITARVPPSSSAAASSVSEARSP